MWTSGFFDDAHPSKQLKLLGNARSVGGRCEALGALAVMVAVRYAPGAGFGGEHGEPRPARQNDTSRAAFRGDEGGFLLSRRYIVAFE